MASATTKAATTRIHPLVRDLYKRVLHVGKDYPLPMSKIRDIWKSAIRNPNNCPSCYDPNTKAPIEFKQQQQQQCEREIRLAVGKGRHMVREMIGIIQLKKYRTIKRNYDYGDHFHFNDKNNTNNKNENGIQSSSSSSPPEDRISSAEDAMKYFNDLKKEDTTTKTAK